MLRWYAIYLKIKTKKKFFSEVAKRGKKSNLKSIKSIILYEFDRDTVGLSLEDGLLSGYALIQLNSSMLKYVIKEMDDSKIGRFIIHGKDGLPYPVPEEEVKRFQLGVREKKEEFHVGDKVRITDGILKGFDGEVVKKNKLMVDVKVLLPNSTIIRPVNIMSLEKRK